MQYDKLCSQIVDIDPKVRLAAVYNKWTEKLTEKIQDGVSINLPERVTKEAVGQAIMRWESRMQMKEWIGTAKCSMSEYEKIKRFTFYLNENDLLLVSTEPDMNHDLLVSRTNEYVNVKN